MSLVQTKQGSAASGSLTITLDAPTTAGNALIVVLASSGTTTNPTSVSSITLGGSAGNFASVSTFGSASDAAIGATWLDLNCVGGQTSVAITMTGGTGTIATLATVYEWSGLVSASAFDKASGGVNAGATSWSSGATAAVSQPSELLVGGTFVTVSGSSPTITGPNAPWNNLSQIAQVQGSFNDAWMSGYQVVSSGGTATYSGTVAPSSQSISEVATFKLLVSEPAPQDPLFLPVDSPLYGLAPWGGAPDASHDVIVNAGTASITFLSPATRPMMLLALTSESGPGATAITRDDPYAISPALLTPDDVTGGMQPWSGAPDSVTTTAVSVTAGVASLSFVAQSASAGLAALPGTGSIALAAQAPTAAVGALPAAASVTLVAQAPAVSLASLPGAAAVSISAQALVAGLGVLPGAAAVTFTASPATAGLGALPSAASITTTAPQEISDVGSLPGNALIVFAAQGAAGVGIDGTWDFSAPLFLPDDPYGGMLPWAGSADGIVTGDASANAGVASMTVAAQSPVAALGVSAGVASMSIVAQSASAGLSALPGTGSLTFAAQGPTVALSSLPGTATVALAGRSATAGLGTNAGVASVSFVARSASAGLASLPGSGSITLAGNGPQAAVGALPAAASVVLAARDSSVGLAALPSASSIVFTALAAGVPGTVIANAGVASISFTARAPAAGTGALPGTAVIAFTGRSASTGVAVLPGSAAVTVAARGAAVVLPQVGTPTLIFGREPVSGLSGRESISSASGSETGPISGRQPLSSTSGTEAPTSIKGRES